MEDPALFALAVLTLLSAIVVIDGSIWIGLGTLAGTVVPKAASVALIIFAAALIGTVLVR